MAISAQLSRGVLGFSYQRAGTRLGFLARIQEPRYALCPGRRMGSRPSAPICPASSPRLVGASGEQRPWPTSVTQTFTRTSEQFSRAPAMPEMKRGFRKSKGSYFYSPARQPLRRPRPKRSPFDLTHAGLASGSHFQLLFP